ncbi:MAG: hypothetical protein IPJ13_26555 [Saprospiraceae bacterium]|nr:hypothetical protein [Saprospiraceae bacterium]
MATVLAFHPGQLVQTSSIFDASCEHQPFFAFIRSSITRHLRGDWGDCCEQDQDSNEIALQEVSEPLFSVSHTCKGFSLLRARFGSSPSHPEYYCIIPFRVLVSDLIALVFDQGYFIYSIFHHLILHL